MLRSSPLQACAVFIFVFGLLSAAAPSYVVSELSHPVTAVRMYHLSRATCYLIQLQSFLHLSHHQQLCVDQLQWLLLIRFLVGIGLGGVPVAFALFAEFCPVKGRGGWLIALQVGVESSGFLLPLGVQSFSCCAGPWPPQA